MTVSELKQHTEDWLNKFQAKVRYDPSEALKQLENFGLLVTKQKGKSMLLNWCVVLQSKIIFNINVKTKITLVLTWAIENY